MSRQKTLEEFIKEATLSTHNLNKGHKKIGLLLR